MAFDPLSPEVTYAMKGNVKYPGTSAQATAAQTLAASRLADAFPQITSTTLAAGSISVAS